MIQKTTVLLLLGFTSLSALASQQASTTSNAGQFLRQVQPPVPGSKTTPPSENLDFIQLPPPSDTSRSASQTALAKNIKIHITRLVFQGNTVFDNATLNKIAGINNKNVTIDELRAAIKRITQYYHTQGYFLAFAYLSVQKISDGILKVGIVEGNLSRIDVTNHSQVLTKRIQSILNSHLIIGRPLNLKASNRVILLLRQMPGIGDVKTSLHPGPTFGTTVLDVVVSAAPRISGNVGADNYGTSFIGNGRFNTLINVDNLMHIGDRLSLQETITDTTELNYGRLFWEVPVGNDGFHMGTSFSQVNYVLGASLAPLNSNGFAQVATVYGTYPFLLTPKANGNVGLSLEYRNLNDLVNASDYQNPRQIEAAVLSISGSYTDRLLHTKGINSWRMSNTGGDVSILNASQLATDAATAQTNGLYDKIMITLSREQSLFDNFSLFVSGNGQWSNKNLDASEQFSLGGPGVVRAYPFGEAPGDEGMIGVIELRNRLSSHLQLLTFFDVGKIYINNTPYIDQPNTRTLAGPGIAANVQWGKFNFSTSLAWRVTSPAVSDVDKRPRGWLQGSYNF